MDLNEEQLDYDDDDHGGGNNNIINNSRGMHFQGAISALTEAEEEEEVPDDEEYDDLYQDVNVGFIEPQEVQVQPPTPPLSVVPDMASQTQLELLPPPSEIRTRVGDYADPQGTTISSSAAVGEESGGGRGFQVLSSSVTAVEDESGRGLRTFSSSTALVEEESGPRFRAVPPPGLELRSVRAGGESTSGPGGGRVGAAGSAAGTPTSTPRSAIGDYDYAMGSAGGGGGSSVFVGDLQWWTTDADLEAMLSEYGKVKEIKFFEERASGKSKGYCQVHFYDPNAGRLCKEGMNGRLINGKPCLVAYKSPRISKQIGDTVAPSRGGGGLQEKRMINDGGGGIGGGGGRMGGGGYHGGGDGGGGGGGRHYGRTGRGGHGQGRGPGGHGRGRGGKGAGGNNGGGHYGQGLLGPMGMQPGGMMPPMANQGFDPGFGAQMGRGGGAGGYGGFAPHGAHFAGMMPSFPTVGSVGLPGVAPHVNPAFFGRGMTGNGMAMMPGGGNSSGITEGHQGMWSEAMWGADGSSRRVADSSHVDDLGSEYGYGGYGGEKIHDRAGGAAAAAGGGGRSSGSRMRERGLDNDWVGNSDKRHRSDRDMDWDRERDRYREKDRDGYRDQREREHNYDRDDEYGRERAARPRSKSRAIEEEDPRSVVEYGKRRR